MLPLELILQARNRLRGHLPHTPLVRSTTLSRRLGASVYLKLENLQKTGSFKPRGAFNKLLCLSANERSRGVVAVSGGNHAQGVAYAAQQLGVSAIIAMPEATPRNYLDATRSYGAEILLTSSITTAFEEAHRLECEGRVLVHPFDDPLIAAGQGTIGLEILDDLPDATHIFVSIGGGGLIAGLATAVKAARPETHILGVQTHGADAMAQSLAARELVELPAITSIARTLGAPRVSDFTLNAVRELVEDVIVVDDAATADALFFLLERTKCLVEPAAACCLVAADRCRETFKPDDKIVLLLCGGNVSIDSLVEFRKDFAKPANAT